MSRPVGHRTPARAHRHSPRGAGPAGAGPADSGAAGFTLVEMLAVIAILSLLMGLLIVGVGRYRQKAYEEGTRGVLQQVIEALESYRAVYAAYPPDGYDFPVQRERGPGQGGRIRGAQCLVYFLGLPTLRTAEYGDRVVQQERDPFLNITEGMITGSGELDERLASPANELIDAYGNPIHYDNTKREDTGLSRVSIQTDASSHGSPGLAAELQHGPDPRATLRGGKAGNPGAFDVWSHGTDPEDPADDITNWK